MFVVLMSSPQESLYSIRVYNIQYTFLKIIAFWIFKDADVTDVLAVF